MDSRRQKRKRRQASWVVAARTDRDIEAYLREHGEAGSAMLAAVVGRPRTRVAHWLASHPDKYEALIRSDRRWRIVYRLTGQQPS